jgi:hypothetical protein
MVAFGYFITCVPGNDARLTVLTDGYCWQLRLFWLNQDKPPVLKGLPADTIIQSLH